MPRALCNGVEIEYELHPPTSTTVKQEADGRPQTLVLIMGIGCQLVHWPDGFLAALTAEGYQVVVFDNRDIGLSGKQEQHKPYRYSRMDTAQWLMGKRMPAPYSLDDMAADTVGLLDHLGIAKAHIVGASMGGMITQVFGINHPDRAHSLTIMMSTSGKRHVGLPRPAALKVLGARPSGTDKETLINFGMKNWQTLQGSIHKTTDEELRPWLERIVNRSIYPAGYIRQMQAIMNAGNREKALRGVRVPALVLHGKDDPLIHPSGGKSIAKSLPNAELQIIDGWGHDFPRALYARIVSGIDRTAQRAFAS